MACTLCVTIALGVMRATCHTFKLKLLSKSNTVLASEEYWGPLYDTTTSRISYLANIFLVWSMIYSDVVRSSLAISIKWKGSSLAPRLVRKDLATREIALVMTPWCQVCQHLQSECRRNHDSAASHQQSTLDRVLIRHSMGMFHHSHQRLSGRPSRLTVLNSLLALLIFLLMSLDSLQLLFSSWQALHHSDHISCSSLLQEEVFVDYLRNWCPWQSICQE